MPQGTAQQNLAAGDPLELFAVMMPVGQFWRHAHPRTAALLTQFKDFGESNKDTYLGAQKYMNRELADRRIFPAINLAESGTRKEELILPPDVVVKSAPIVAAISIVAIGSWMLFGETRRRWRLRTAAGERAHEHAEHDHGAGHDHDHGRAEHDAAEHSHGGVRHSHLPTAGSTISWRSLFVLGLAGGLIPSTNALLILLGSIAAGRPTFGFVLVVAFGLGMALVMGGIGLALVLARGRLDRVDAASRLGRISAYVPIAAAVLVFSLGIYLTVQAVAGKTTF